MAGLDPHELASHSWAIEALWLNAITLCVARYTQGTWQRFLFLTSDSCLQRLSHAGLQSRLVLGEKGGTGVQKMDLEWNESVNTEGTKVVHKFAPRGIIKFQNIVHVDQPGRMIKIEKFLFQGCVFSITTTVRI